MARYPLNLPQQLKQEAESWAKQQGISLNQFILWATAEKVGALKERLDDPRFLGIAYRRGSSGIPTPTVRGSGIRVQTIVTAGRQWGLSTKEIAAEYGLNEGQVAEALDFYAAPQEEIDGAIAAEAALEARIGE
jgi:uncharacterized protein (DUF433 family)